MKIARVFPRKTNATPDDNLVFFGDPPKALDVDEVHISLTFSYDKDIAANLYESWKDVAPIVKVGGPAMGDPGGDFTPGLYVKDGYVMTSRGCPNNCWFCDVHPREGDIRELPITHGWNLLDSNILACSDSHVKKVFKMLKNTPRPKGQTIQLSGGLEAKILTHYHISLLWDLRPRQMFFAYDTPDDFEPLLEAGKKLRYANFTRQHLRCYVLVGWKKDTIAEAEKRLLQTWSAGFMPMAMLWKNKTGDTDEEWARFVCPWARPVITKNKAKEMYQANVLRNSPPIK